MTDLPDPSTDPSAATPEPAPIEGAPQGRPPMTPDATPRTDGSAVAALLCAIGSWFLVPVALAVVALVLARKAERAIDACPAELTGRGLLTGARWIAWTHLVLVAMVVAFVSAFAIAVRTGR
jgi:hypothetical protein